MLFKSDIVVEKVECLVFNRDKIASYVGVFFMRGRSMSVLRNVW